jgi:hypothetical protein
MRNDAKKAKKWCVCFAKTCENEAKQVEFRFISLRSENFKKAKKGHPTPSFQRPKLLTRDCVKV